MRPGIVVRIKKKMLVTVIAFMVLMIAVPLFFTTARVDEPASVGKGRVEETPAGKTWKKKPVNQEYNIDRKKMEQQTVDRLLGEIHLNHKKKWQVDLFNNTRMVFVPAGEFLMGSTGRGSRDEQPQHRVFLDGYWISTFEVTFDQYDRFCKEKEMASPDDEGWRGKDIPVINVDWHEARAYCEWMGEQTGLDFELPTEAQWEKAARGGKNTVYFWGNEPGIAVKQVNVADQALKDSNPMRETESWDDGFAYTAPVHRTRRRLSNPFGLYDVTGNVWEWTYDNYSPDYYQINRTPLRNPRGPRTGPFKTARGGSWGSVADKFRLAVRKSLSPRSKSFSIGFRPVMQSTCLNTIISCIDMYL